MKFAVSYNPAYYGVDPDRIMAYARHAEDCGFESLYLPEHSCCIPVPCSELTSSHRRCHTSIRSTA